MFLGRAAEAATIHPFGDQMHTESSGSAEDVLVDVALEFGTTVDLDGLLPMVLERVTAMLGAERALFAIYDADGQLERAVVHNLDWEGLGHPLPVSQGLIERVKAKDEIILIADAKSHAMFKDRGSVQALAVRFMVGVPVHIEGRVGGVICVDSRSVSGDPSPHDVKLLTALAKLVGTAVDKALLFEHQQFRSTLLSQLIHDFRTPLSVITMNAGLLAQIGAPNAPEAHEMAYDIAASAERMSQMIESTLELSKIDSGTTTPTPKSFDVLGEIPRHLLSLEVVARPLDLRLEPSIPVGLPQVFTIPQWVWIVFDNLLFNALKHSHNGTTIKISAGKRDSRGPAEALERPRQIGVNLFRHLCSLSPTAGTPFVEITVENRGPALEDNAAMKLFAPRDQGTPASGSVEYVGLSLAIVDQCIRHLGGCVWLDRWRDGDIAFSFSLPTSVDLPTT